MIRYLIRRVLQGVFVLWAAYTLSFLILYLLPGDAATVAAAGGGDASSVDPALVVRLRHEYGLDEPLWLQYLHALGRALTGNFGDNVQTGQPALQAVVRVLPNTLELAAAALVLAIVIGFLVAIASTFPRAAWIRQLLAGLPPIGAAVPVFWIGLLLLQAFSFHLRWFPSLGDQGLRSLVLPAVTLSVPTGAYIAQLLARSLRLTLGRPYIEQVRAKGASEARVHFAHALRNAVLPTLTMVGVLVGNLLAGTVVTETVFSRTGVGRLVVQAVGDRDLPVVQVVVVFAAVAFVVSSLVVDLLYPFVDRRITLGRTAVAAA
ncbi:MAG TPA: ABC transporter permease [Gryllotalpicola sp.]